MKKAPAGLLVLIALIVGCSDDRRDYEPIGGSGHTVALSPSDAAAPAPAPIDGSPTLIQPLVGSRDIAPQPKDTIAQTRDPLLQTKDPLLQGTGLGGTALDESASSRFTKTPDPLGAAPIMPTEHSHWLRGSIFNARVTVTLNNAPLGTFMSPIDKDITMKCRKGYNAITFAYEPSMASSSVHLDVLESEHTPPIAPLATFQVLPTENPSQPGAISSDSDSSAMASISPASGAITRTFSFIAE